jgi:hypothetical protein
MSFFYSEWQEKFAWFPVRARNGKILWLRKVFVRDIQVSLDTISIIKFSREYDTHNQIFLEKLAGKNV